MFKVGDKVRRLEDCNLPLRGISRAAGTISTVSKVSDAGSWMGLVGQTHDVCDPVPFATHVYELVKPDKVPHVHAEVIKAWADGATIQVHRGGKTDTWEDHVSPSFAKEFKYRVKPEPKPDVKQIMSPTLWNPVKKGTFFTVSIEYTYDGETGKLKAVELI